MSRLVSIIVNWHFP